MTADCAAAEGQRAEQGLSWLGEGGSAFSEPAEELKSVSSQRADRQPRMASCSVPSGMAAEGTASPPPSEFCIPGGWMSSLKCSCEGGEGWTGWIEFGSTGTSCAGRLFGLGTLGG